MIFTLKIIKMKRITLLLVCLFSLVTYGQKKLSFEILTGIGSNKSLSLLNQDIQDYTIFTTQINANYRFKLYKDFSAETGLGGQWYFSSGSVGLSKFKTTSLRLNLPLIISYPIREKITVGAGVSITTNDDFDDIDFKTQHSLRTSLLLKGSYALNEDFGILLIIKQNVSDIPDLYFVNQSSTDILVGVSFNII